ncbi:hypothetical protein [Lysinibacter sp. HNR]|uniref:hypothetical protein n=1 Tax=Lysinibacter sp. HNR TaxID=3031408 RepID=UPI00243541DD|nr:hypothetical protein [Lysinibacter sp. HNR]WGD37478.1 hypothetical protein FrondiHNR_00715 [Lysinibacter sp. HNR]
MTSISRAMNTHTHPPLRTGTLEINHTTPVTATPTVIASVTAVIAALGIGIAIGATVS